MARKWIDKRIATLDPVGDYVEIVRLSYLYRVNMLQLDWLYTVNTIHASINPDVIDAVYRGGLGKYGTKPTERSTDTIDHLIVWFEHGPDAPATRQSLDMVNRSHAHFSKKFPKGLADVDDYIYILCLNGTAMHVAMCQMGLVGHSEEVKIAAHRFWSRLTEHFIAVMDGRSVTQLKPFPASFDAMVRFVEDYQARQWPPHESGAQSTHGAIEHFAARRFPRGLRWFGRSLVTTFLCSTTRRVHRVRAPNAPAMWLAKTFMKLAVFFQAHIQRDPALSLPDRRRELIWQRKHPQSAIDNAAHAGLDGKGRHRGTESMARGCPHMPTPPIE